MRHLVVSILFVFLWVCAPLAYGSEAAATFESWEPSSHALSLAQDVEATPMDRSRTAHLVQRFEHLVLDAKLAHQPTQQQIASALDASWVVASCWPTDLFDRRLQNPETDDLADLRTFFEDPATLTGVRARLGVLLTEYEVYAQAMSESLAKALCLPERQGAIISSLKRDFLQQQVIQSAMCESPLWWKSFARLSTDASSIEAKVVMPSLPPGEVAPVPRMTWADLDLRRFPLALDPAVPPWAAAAALALNADCRIMSLANL